jgi:hypothetical protein
LIIKHKAVCSIVGENTNKGEIKGATASVVGGKNTNNGIKQ